ncbi:Hypothetical protein PBC10988_14650 [Planctomycetales bacterium 10988]|nr:Hypothetical protein PBC10988_14650 [Planctomycetales bacterium 10988]
MSSNHSEEETTQDRLSVRRTSLVTLILDRLRELIAARGLRPGDRLPPERQLAAQLQVSRPSLRAALDWLNQRGALRRVQGGGTYLESNFAEILAQAQEKNLSASTFSEIVEARVYLEPMLARLAVRRASREQVESLQREVIEVGKLLPDPSVWHQHDLRFHTQIARFSGNSVLSSALEGLFPQVLASWQLGIHLVDLKFLHNQHREIIEAILMRDEDLAASRAQEHLEHYQSMLKQSSNERMHASQGSEVDRS